MLLLHTTTNNCGQYISGPFSYLSDVNIHDVITAIKLKATEQLTDERALYNVT